MREYLRKQKATRDHIARYCAAHAPKPATRAPSVLIARAPQAAKPPHGRAERAATRNSRWTAKLAALTVTARTRGKALRKLRRAGPAYV